jgi:hypothetical protein
MHITKNVCESLFGTLLNMPEKTKDGPKARNDLKFMGIRRELYPPSDDDDEPGGGGYGNAKLSSQAKKGDQEEDRY